MAFLQGSGPAGRAAGLAAQPLLQSSSGIPMNVLCEFHLSTFSVVHQWGKGGGSSHPTLGKWTTT